MDSFLIKRDLDNKEVITEHLVGFTTSDLGMYAGVQHKSPKPRFLYETPPTWP